MADVWTDSERRTWARTLATCQKLAARAAKYRAMVPYMPQFAEMVRDFLARYEHCRQLAEIAIAADTPAQPGET